MRAPLSKGEPPPARLLAASTSARRLRRYSVHYTRVPRLFADLALAHGDGRFGRLCRTLVKADEGCHRAQGEDE